MKRFTDSARVRVIDAEHQMVGKAGTVVRLRRADDGAWVRMDDRLPDGTASFPADDDHANQTLLYPEQCEAEADDATERLVEKGVQFAMKVFRTKWGPSDAAIMAAFNARLTDEQRRLGVTPSREYFEEIAKMLDAAYAVDRAAEANTPVSNTPVTPAVVGRAAHEKGTA